jgi:hypothetical protein
MGSLTINSQKFLFRQRGISRFRCLVARAFVAILAIVLVTLRADLSARYPPRRSSRGAQLSFQ